MGVGRTLKRMALAVATSGPVSSVVERTLGDRAVVFMLHRFRNRDVGIDGHDPAVLRDWLGELRRRRYELVDIRELAERVRSPGRALTRTVAFTIDDGYADQAEIGAPVFAEFDCPVTTFVTTGFLDGRLWFWWDQIEYLFRRTERSSVEIAADGKRLTYHLSDADQRGLAQAHFTEWCKSVDDELKHRSIAALAASAEVEIPNAPPPEYVPLSWNQLRRCEQGGMTFGPHTVTHPILSQTSDAQSREELAQSWSRLEAEAQNPMPVFCYPNGQAADFGEREISVLRELGLQAAVVGIPGYLERPRDGEADGPYHLRRFSWSDIRTDVQQCLNGVAWVKSLIRGTAA